MPAKSPPQVPRAPSEAAVQCPHPQRSSGHQAGGEKEAQPSLGTRRLDGVVGPDQQLPTLMVDRGLDESQVLDVAQVRVRERCHMK